MRSLTVVSGKGGTGKTLFSTNLAWLFHQKGVATQLLDVDAEEPNASLFVQFIPIRTQPVEKLIPHIDEGLCDRCGLCMKECQFSAITIAPKKMAVLAPLCHGCGLCARLCPQKAITELPKTIGNIRLGKTQEGFSFGEGILNIGEPSAVPVIRQLKNLAPKDAQIRILDAPPGASCSVVESLSGSDSALLVTEPTPFGLHDLRAAIAVVSEMKIPFKVVINRFDAGSSEYVEKIRHLDAEVIATLPFDRKIASVYAEGKLVVKELPKYLPVFERIIEAIGRGFA
ncbi:MAG TPA: ATP-binding protein [Thermotogota bacterium]|jgi:MinD superfamily P-loop ATPase|nr:ATP-binding protein [Thermotogota bacterium]HQK82288.1 ATP-binding protein [Thermotogota bacterium]